jgi:hypothetical protein
MATLSRKYLFAHMNAQATAPPDADENQRLQEFAKQLIDGILSTAQDQLESDTDERDQIDITLPVTLTPVHDAPEGGCVGVSVGFATYHQNFKGDNPGDG